MVGDGRREEGGRSGGRGPGREDSARAGEAAARPSRPGPPGRQEAAALEKRRAQVKAWYDDPSQRALLVEERQVLDDLARRLGKRQYDLDEPPDRRAFRGRLLSFVRPPARDRLMDLAARYRAQFSRPLPVTSLVRTEQYQRQLGETNPNATKISIPPHTTGLAYDMYYHYMTGPEQDALMAMVAQDESAGLVESLRENRDHIHIFAFADGHRPPETLVAEALGVVRRRERRRARPSRVARPRGASGPAAPRSRPGVRRRRGRPRPYAAPASARGVTDPRLALRQFAW
jgi:hypothetical protein